MENKKVITVAFVCALILFRFSVSASRDCNVWVFLFNNFALYFVLYTIYRQVKKQLYPEKDREYKLLINQVDKLKKVFRLFSIIFFSVVAAIVLVYFLIILFFNINLREEKFSIIFSAINDSIAIISLGFSIDDNEIINKLFNKYASKLVY